MRERVFHVSETPGITRFDPRVDDKGRNRVWAIGESRLHNYLLPRDCPRVTYYATTTTTPADRRAFFSVSDAASVVAIEQAWLPALRSAQLHVYEFDASAFTLEDSIAAYYVCARAATPIACAQSPIRCWNCSSATSSCASVVAVAAARRRRRVEPGVLDHPDAQCEGAPEHGMT